MDHSPLNDVLVLLACSVGAVAIFRRFHLPPILGYLMVGVLTGSHALGWVPDGEAIHLLAEVGVVFLLFMIGLEISIPHLLAMKSTVLGLGSAQVLITLGLAGGIAWYLGVEWQGALILGGIVALSSTAIATKQLIEQLEMQSRHGRIALGILLFQDLAVVPFLVLIPILADPGGGSMLQPMLWALAKAAFAFALMFALGHWALRPLFHMVAGAHSIELFTLTILLVSLAAAALTYQLGLSLALGAFLAGMMLGETEYRHQVEAEVRPFRDVLMGLFFISVGTQLDLMVLPEIWHWVVLITLGLILGKAAIVIAITHFGGHEFGVALRSGLVLAQGGEFGFALITLGIAQGLFSSEVTQPVLAAIVLSMILAPLIIRHNGTFAKQVCANYLGRRMAQAQNLSQASDELSGHVIVCGFGRIGQNLASFLKEEGFDYVALDLDPVLIREAWEAGEQVFYGDSRNAEILHSAGIERARALVVTFHDHHLSEQIIHTARKVSAEIMIVARTHDDHHLEDLEQAGANDVVPESIEASMMLAAHTLRHLDVDKGEIDELIEKARADHYSRLRGYFHGESFEDQVEEEDHFHRHSLVLTEQCRAVGRRIGELGLASHDIEVIGLRRHGIHGETPDPEIILQANDTLIIQGPPKKLEHAEEILVRG
ncbi:monovalent cation:proton antiporter family protein [Candidatus Endoriftia persephone]|jgi:CPA2 family monovalent cation:H+ antiporter-2|uniref:Glutathione-regulated potassium-efflux system protein KefB n=3 Tax=Gammaproteobacteria TaxID=1236 RepID=G2FGS9_9GAMM|nr:monovalent cation:proton antiporter family protein [Candidatus Endoriftia persephone]EGV51264.1 glutathione-regulated potassium-efflux system protein kefB [endosymbiont of Riftia pachyptila (vent Ph05)]EGW54043.1 glutathione-regulated potassium-efflux system protein KefB [endosymbiont of Tevnia jerichonana (vent Tica)]USF86590.1 cation:proton antiporter [Candidatus Endoriftia persephone]